MNLKKYIDTEFAMEMHPSLSIGWQQEDYKSIKRERKIAKKYGLDFKSMRKWKWAYYFLSLVSIFTISDLMYDKFPAALTAFVVTIWLMLLVFFLPKQFVYRFSKKL